MAKPRNKASPEAIAKARRASHEAIAKARKVAEAADIIWLPEIGQSADELSLSSLWLDLCNAASWFVVGQKYRKAPPLNKKLIKVAKQANRLAALLSDEDVFCFLQDNLPAEMQLHCAPDNEGEEGYWHVHAFASVIADVALQRQISPMSVPGPVISSLGLGRLSAIVNLVGSGLVRVYEKYAMEKVKFHRGRSGAGPVGGKFLAFAHQALSELDITVEGEPLANETIVRACTDAKRVSPRTHRAKRAKALS